MTDFKIHVGDSVKVSDSGQILMDNNTLGIATPSELDASRFDKLSKLIVGVHPGEFIQAWNGIIYRMRASIDAGELYSRTTEKDHETKYIRANAVFNFFVTALSSIECFSSAIYSIGVTLDKNIFSDSKPSPKDTVKALNEFDSTSGLYKSMAAIISSTEYNELRDIRNYLAHHGNPSTNYRRGIGNPAGDGQSSTIRQHFLEYDSNTIRQRLHWLIDQVNILLALADEFCDKYKLKYMD